MVISCFYVLLRRLHASGWLSADVGLKHVAEELSLLDGIVKRHMRMRHGVEPLRGHRLLAARSIWFAQQCHRVGLDINCRIAEGVCLQFGQFRAVLGLVGSGTCNGSCNVGTETDLHY